MTYVDILPSEYLLKKVQKYQHVGVSKVGKAAVLILGYITCYTDGGDATSKAVACHEESVQESGLWRSTDGQTMAYGKFYL